MILMTPDHSTLPSELPKDAVCHVAYVPRTKRLLDVVLILLGLPLALPLVLSIVILQKLTTRGPVFFRQQRVGQNGRVFNMLKFRSMHVDAESRLAEVKQGSDREGICFKQKHDPRVTMLGRFLRRSSLDELPQLWNVLRGEMSLVGPRPALPQEVAEYPEAAMGRLAGLPGLTGLWQISGRADLDFDQMIELDLLYLQNISVATDLRILFGTFGAVFTGRGAY